MNKYFIVFLSMLFSFPVFAQNRVEAVVSNFENNDGICYACIYPNAASFSKQRPRECAQSLIINNASKVVFNNIPDGEYAVFVFHDRNRNNKMDLNWLGIPKEGYGASNNKLPFAAAPKFEANKFSVLNKSVEKLNIRLRNM